MAFLNIIEFAEVAIGPAGRVGQFAQQPHLAKQNIVNTGASTQSAAFNAQTRIVRLETDSLCAVEFGTNPTAIAAGANGSLRMAVGQTEYFGVPLGQSFKVAVVLTT